MKVEWRNVALQAGRALLPLSAAVYDLHLRLWAEVIAIGDTANPVVPAWLGLPLAVLNFPMFYLWFPLGEWLKPHLTDDGVIELFAAINAVFWGAVLVRPFRLSAVRPGGWRAWGGQRRTRRPARQAEQPDP